jgi:hypothetical protein
MSQADRSEDRVSVGEVLFVTVGGPTSAAIFIVADCYGWRTWWSDYALVLLGGTGAIAGLGTGIVALVRGQKRRATTMINLFLMWILMLLVVCFVIPRVLPDKPPAFAIAIYMGGLCGMLLYGFAAREPAKEN